MEPKDVFLEALAQATIVIDKVTPDDFHKPTPNTAWNVLQLSGHMLYELCWVADLLAGKTIKDVGDNYEGDLIGRHGLEANWHAAAQAAKEAVSKDIHKRLVHVSSGDMNAEAYLSQVATDLLIHAWDLGEGIGEVVQFEPELASAVYAYVVQHAAEMQAANLYGASVDVPDDTSLQAKVLALSGRSMYWRTA